MKTDEQIAREVLDELSPEHIALVAAGRAAERADMSKCGECCPCCGLLAAEREHVEELKRECERQHAYTADVVDQLEAARKRCAELEGEE